MMLFNKIHNMDNLYWAWKKAKKIYETEDFTINFKELAEFETNLSENLRSIAKDINEDSYKLQPISRLPLPKRPDNRNKAPVRQNFNISVRDQVAWIAVINIIGPALDYNMPFWSYGNRLYVPVWVEPNPQNSERFIRKYGKYRHSTSSIYRKWSTSWPLFRKSIYLSVKQMAFGYKPKELNKQLDSEDLDDINSNDLINAPELQIKYWKKDYWNQDISHEVYWGSIDFSKFYPSVTSKRLIDNIKKYVRETPDTIATDEDVERIVSLIEKLCDFNVSKSIWNKKDVDDVGIDQETGHFTGIPTGLFVAGFLSNVGMLDIDNKVADLLNKNRKVAHFRFVDDHVFLADSADELVKWICNYIDIIKNDLDGEIKIKPEKTVPSVLGEIISNIKINAVNSVIDEKAKTKIHNECKLNAEMPSPLMTRTLKKVSAMNRTTFELLDDNEKLLFVTELEHLLVTDFPNDELKKETRVSWVATMLNRVVSKINFDTSKFYNYSRDVELKKLEIRNIKRSMENNNKAIVNNNADDWESEIADLEKRKDGILEHIRKQEDDLYKKTFSLIRQAIKSNFYKPRIWKKGIDFCRSTGYFKGCEDLFDMLEEIYKSKQLKRSAYMYLYATILSAICENIVFAYKIIQSPNDFVCENLMVATMDEIDKAKRFLQNQLIKKPVGRSTEYVRTIGNLYSIINDMLISKSNTIDLLDQENIYFTWWVLKKVGTNYENSKSIFRSLHERDTYLGDDKNNSIIRKLLLLYANDPNADLDEHWFLDSDTKTIVQSINKAKRLSCCEFNEKYMESKNNSLLLSEWIVYSDYLAKNRKTAFDIRLTEYFALEIIRLIIENITKISFENFNVLMDNIESDKIISLSNFRITFSNLSASQGRNDVINIDEYVKIEYVGTEKLPDIRYVPEFTKGNLTYDMPINEKKNVYALGVMLVKLLSRNLLFVPQLNTSERIEKPYHLIMRQVEHLPISSYTYALILGCLTTRYYESAFLDDYICLLNRDDSDKDPVKIETLDDLLKYISITKEVLKFHQINLDGNMFRQLVPISLLQINQNENPYFEGEKLL